MIDVPVRVKDALREGNMRKNYKLHIYPNFTLLSETASVPFEFVAPYDQVFYITIDDATDDPYAGWEYSIYDSDGTLIDTEFVPIYPLGQEPWTKTYFTVPLTKGQYITFDIPEDIGIHVSINDYVSDSLFVIENDNLVKESVKIDERLCSSDTLKFGLCEGSSLEFQYFGLENITGRRIKAEVEIQYTDTDSTVKWHTIPMGWFTVAQTSRQASTGIMKVTAYNKLKSEYLDEALDVQIKEYITEGESGTSDQLTLYKLLNILLSSYSIEQHDEIRTALHVNYGGSHATFTDSVQQVSPVTQTLTYYFHTYSVLFNTSDLDPDEYYKIRFNFKDMLQYMIDEWAYDRITVRLGSQDMTLTEYAKTINGKYWGGNIQLVNSDQQVFVDEYIGIWLDKHPGSEIFETDYSTDIYAIRVTLPCGSNSNTSYQLDSYDDMFKAGHPSLSRLVLSSIEKKKISTTQISNTQNMTIRELQSAVYEINCQYGKLDRVTDLFSGVTLGSNALYPYDTLYPLDSLYPQGGAERGNFSMYGKLWADENNVHSFRYLFITYKGTVTESGQTTEVEKTMQLTINADGTDDYYVNNNWLFKNIVWDDADIAEYGRVMCLDMQNITWFPFELWCAGLPYIETGDEVEINLDEQAYTSYVLRRSLNGIQNLQDDFINGTLDIF